jgi:hypothetical protein
MRSAMPPEQHIRDREGSDAGHRPGCPVIHPSTVSLTIEPVIAFGGLSTEEATRAFLVMGMSIAGPTA